MGTKDKGIKCTSTNKGLECYADADFTGNWDEQMVPDNKVTAWTPTGYIIKYAGAPITWASCLQTP
jgi:hypothetical protein